MVVIFLPAASETGIEQERVATPSTCTVQAPHCAMPQPYFVPVRPTCSRITHSSGVVGSTSMLCDCPLMVSATMFSLSRSPIGELFPASARDGHVPADFFEKRASAESLTIPRKMRHRNSVNARGCHSREDIQDYSGTEITTRAWREMKKDYSAASMTGAERRPIGETNIREEVMSVKRRTFLQGVGIAAIAAA